RGLSLEPVLGAEDPNHRHAVLLEHVHGMAAFAGDRGRVGDEAHLLALEGAALLAVEDLQAHPHSSHGGDRRSRAGRPTLALPLRRRIAPRERVVSARGGGQGQRQRPRAGAPHGLARPLTTASATRRRTCRMASLSRVGWTRLVSRMMKSWRSGSIHIEVPVKPVWPKARGESSSPAEEAG